MTEKTIKVKNVIFNHLMIYFASFLTPQSFKQLIDCGILGIKINKSHEIVILELSSINEKLVEREDYIHHAYNNDRKVYDLYLEIPDDLTTLISTRSFNNVKIPVKTTLHHIEEKTSLGKSWYKKNIEVLYDVLLKDDELPENLFIPIMEEQYQNI